MYLMDIVAEHGGLSLEPVLSSGAGASRAAAVQRRERGSF
jgi:hypothetical protein